MKLNPFTIILLLAVSIIIASCQHAYNNLDATLPNYALKTPQIKEAYTFAKTNPSALTNISCFCGCMQGLNVDKPHTRGVIDCFIESNGDFDSHASTCPLCVEEALRVKALLKENKTHEQINSTINSEFKSRQKMGNESSCSETANVCSI